MTLHFPHKLWKKLKAVTKLKEKQKLEYFIGLTNCYRCFQKAEAWIPTRIHGRLIHPIASHVFAGLCNPAPQRDDLQGSEPIPLPKASVMFPPSEAGQCKSAGGPSGSEHSSNISLDIRIPLMRTTGNHATFCMPFYLWSSCGDPVTLSQKVIVGVSEYPCTMKLKIDVCRHRWPKIRIYTRHVCLTRMHLHQANWTHADDARACTRTNMVIYLATGVNTDLLPHLARIMNRVRHLWALPVQHARATIIFRLFVIGIPLPTLVSTVPSG